MPLSVVRPGLVLLLLPCLVAVQVLAAAPFTVYFWCLNCILLCRLQQQSKRESWAQKKKLFFAFATYVGQELLLLPTLLVNHTPVSLSPHIIVASRRFWLCMSLSALLSLSLCRSCCCGCKFYLSFNIFYGLYAAKRGVGWGCSLLAATHFKWLLKHFILHTKYLPCRRVCLCVWVCMCLRQHVPASVCVSACVCERLCMCCAHLICLITLGCLIGVAAAFILQLRFKPWPETFGIYHV